MKYNWKEIQKVYDDELLSYRDLTKIFGVSRATITKAKDRGELITRNHFKAMEVAKEKYKIEQEKQINYYIKEGPKSYIKDLKLYIDPSHGYEYFVDFFHPLHNKSGKVYHHRHIGSIIYGDWLPSDLHVHHKDKNKVNNEPDNLEILTISEHNSLHALERGHILREEKFCKNCNNIFMQKAGDQKFCSNQCSCSFNGKNLDKNINIEDIKKLVWEIPTLQIAKMYNCSDSAIGKFCKKHNIPKPTRGYWQKINSAANDAHKSWIAVGSRGRT